jgi:transposase
MRTDGRALDHATLTELRKRGVAAVQSGESPMQVAAALGVNLRTLFRWLALYRRGGWDQLDARRRGGRPPKLDGRAQRWFGLSEQRFGLDKWHLCRVQAAAICCKPLK